MNTYSNVSCAILIELIPFYPLYTLCAMQPFRIVPVRLDDETENQYSCTEL